MCFAAPSRDATQCIVDTGAAVAVTHRAYGGLAVAVAQRLAASAALPVPATRPPPAPNGALGVAVAHRVRNRAATAATAAAGSPTAANVTVRASQAVAAQPASVSR